MGFLAFTCSIHDGIDLLSFVQDPSKFAVDVAAAAPADAGAAPAAAGKEEEKKDEPADESDEDMGFSLFD